MSKILFTLLSIKLEPHGNLYVDSCKRLTTEILTQTNHDVLITTNTPDSFVEITTDPRVTLREIAEGENTFKFTHNHTREFNYNMKHVCFRDIPQTYDYIIYLDADIKVTGWDSKSDEYIDNFLTNIAEAGATRTNAILKDELGYYSNGQSLFNHKFSVYALEDLLSLGENILEAKLPSEHFLILKNIPEKVSKFYNTWKYLNTYLENKNGGNGSYCDAFEIGISFQAAQYNLQEVTHGDSLLTLKFYFNGNKYL